MSDPSLREKEPHGTVLFPLRVHEFPSDAARKERVPAHWHPEVELLVVTAGAATFHLDGVSHQVHQDDIVFVAPDQLHAFTAPVGEPFAFFAVVFDPSLVASSVADTIQTKYLDAVLTGARTLPPVTTPGDAWYAQLRQALEAIRAADLTHGPAYELTIKAEVLLAWATLFGASRGRATSFDQDPAQIQLVKNVLTYIRTHFDQPLSASVLAHQFHLSESHLCRIYKAATKTTLTTSITQERLSRAAELLAETAQPISAIALTCGFGNISYFNKRFKAHMHLTPSDYRAAARA
ncbi:AraC family transcriptional regulator [Lacticaseibacillus mingshuiensis]|uniref:AraC family transcriptional regulator n=1 Tax=Lacticaseibacillus mingshuiensis TaxID=2799574 RepID=A0ABW4CLI2_9LACO|nr:AraC family transcriptional regulator [Lacticaseibacillus mingshuiensis]